MRGELGLPASTDPLPDLVGAAWRAYLAGHDPGRPGIHRTVPAMEMLDNEVDLTPRRYLSQAGESAVDPAQAQARISAFGQLVDDLRRSLPAVRPAEATATRTAPHANLTDLIRSGDVSVHRAVSRTRSDGPATPDRAVLSSADILSGTPATGTAARASDDHPGPQVQAGDILIPTLGREIVARVATTQQAGAELGPGVQLVRVQPDLFDPWFIAGILSHKDNLRTAGRASHGSNGTLRIDVRRLSIPVLPLHQQQAYGRAFRQLAEFRGALDQVAAAGVALVREISDGLAAGTFAPHAGRRRPDRLD